MKKDSDMTSRITKTAHEIINRQSRIYGIKMKYIIEKLIEEKTDDDWKEFIKKNFKINPLGDNCPICNEEVTLTSVKCSNCGVKFKR